MSASAALLVGLLLTLSSDPYARSHVDSTNPLSACLYWPAGNLEFYQSQAGNPATGGTEFGAISRAFGSWQQILAGCGNLTLVEGPHVPDRTIGYDEKNPSANKNVVLFRQRACVDSAPSSDACWQDQSCGNKYDCWEYQQGTIALTTSTFNTRGGQIYRADVELNAGQYAFTTVDSPPCTSQPYVNCVAFDVQNTITHEAGHFLGLEHTSYPGSVMNPTAPVGETSKRTIDPGSRSFVCAVYPKGGASQSCNVEPVTPTLGPASCGAAGGSPWPWAAGAGLLGLWLARGWRRGGQGPSR
jgi:hypothetical protein